MAPNEDVYQLVIFSKDRENGSKNQTDFRVQTYPKHVSFDEIELKSASLPFCFRNITSTYGSRLRLNVVPNTSFPIINYTIDLVFQYQYLTISQFIQEFNVKLQEQFTLLGLGAFVVTLSVSGINNFLQLNSNLPNSQVHFYPTETIGGTYLYTMLGLPTDATSSYTFGITYSHIFPNPFTDDLPFRYLFIYIDQLQSYTYLSNTTSTHFVIPVSNYRPYITNGAITEQNRPLVYEQAISFKQKIKTLRTLDKLKTLHIQITDELHNTIIEHVGSIEWSMVLGVSGIIQ